MPIEAGAKPNRTAIFMSSAIHIRNLAKSYPGVAALKGIDLTVEAGAFVGLLGPNGAGKTTTINVLAGLCNKTSGEVRLFGHDLITAYRACRRQVGLVPQEFNFDLFTHVRRTLLFQGGYFGIPRKACELRADELLQEFGLTEKAETPARFLSGGMKRRLLIARALMHAPRLLILDEPTAGVDVDLRRTLWAFLRRTNREGTTVLLTTHYIEEAEALCDRIAIINQGAIVVEDATRNLVNRLSCESVVVASAGRIEDPVIQALATFAPTLNADRHEVVLTFDRAETDYAGMMSQVLATGLSITSIRPVDNRLERVFLQLTGPGDGS